MKKKLVLLLIATVVLCFSGVANAYFGKIGTANYLGRDYNLIYEGELGYQAKDGSYPQPGWGLCNTGDFDHLQAAAYWSSTEYSLNPSDAWDFHFGLSLQGYGGKGSGDGFYALAVRPGEVSFNPVPIPGAVWLFGSGLIGLVGFRRKFGNR